MISDAERALGCGCLPRRHLPRPALRSCSQAGLVNNLNDALAWGLVPLFLAAEGASVGEIGLVAGLYPAVWGIGQIWRRPLVRHHRPQAADRRRDADPGRRAGAARGIERRRGAGRDRCRRPRGRHGARLPHADRRDLRRGHARWRGRRRSASIGSGATWATWSGGLIAGVARRRDRLQRRDRHRRGPDRPVRALGRLQTSATALGRSPRRPLHRRLSLSSRRRSSARCLTSSSSARQTPSWRASSIVSLAAQSSTILPSSKRLITMPQRRTSRPLWVP